MPRPDPLPAHLQWRPDFYKCDYVYGSRRTRQSPFAPYVPETNLMLTFVDLNSHKIVWERHGIAEVGY